MLTVADYPTDVEELNRRREQSWIARSPRGYEIYGYSEGNAVLREPRFNKAASWLYRLDELGVTDGPVRHAWERNLTTIEGKDRIRLRRSLTPQFSPKRIREMGDSVRQIVSGLLDELDTSETVDLISQVCRLLPARTYCHMVDVPLDLDKLVAHFSDDILGPLFTVDTTRRDDHITTHHEATEWIESQVEARRRNPGDDFISALVGQASEGLLSDEELIQQALLILTGSVDNTMHQAGLVLGTLLEDPAYWQRLVSDPALVPKAVEELFRWRPRFGTIFRQATEPVDLQGIRVAEGEYVFVSVRAAHRDPRVFDDPDQLRLDREPGEPLMFGNGPYRCLGQHLARLEITELLRAMVERYPRARLSAPWRRVDSDAVTEVDFLRADLKG
jgi:cytochrome P450